MIDPRPSLLSRITKAVVLWLYRWKGWRLSGERKFPPKFVITGAPHTSNWDFIFFVGAVHELGIKPSFMGKVSLFNGPLKRFMYDMGGLPVDRSKRNNNYVEQAATHFDQADDLALVVAPEGSRRRFTRSTLRIVLVPRHETQVRSLSRTLDCLSLSSTISTSQT